MRQFDAYGALMVFWTLKRVNFHCSLFQHSMRAKPAEEGESRQSAKICTFLLRKGLAQGLFTPFEIFATWEMTLQYEHLNSQSAQCKRCKIFFSSCNWDYCCEQWTSCTDSQRVGEPWDSGLPERTVSLHQGDIGCLANCFFIFKDTSVICAKIWTSFFDPKKSPLGWKNMAQFLLMA